MKFDDSQLPENRKHRRLQRIRRGLVIIVILAAAVVAIYSVTGCATAGIQNPPPPVRMVGEN